MTFLPFIPYCGESRLLVYRAFHTLRHRGTQSRDSLVRRKRNHDRVESLDARQRENGLSLSSSRVAHEINDIIDARRERSTRLDIAMIR